MPSAKGSKKEKKEEPSDERVRVVVRIRPPIRKDEMYGEGSEALQVDKERNLLFLLQKEGQGVTEKTKQFVFDRVLWKDSEQNDAWEAAGLGVTKAALVGYTGCVMCYGQTGAGKTFTLANETADQQGIMVQAFNLIFQTAAEDKQAKYEVHVAYVQIYLDGLSDLLNPDGVVELREDPKEGVYVSGCEWAQIHDVAGAIELLRRGTENRKTACTKMNADSSRSHAVLMISISVKGGPRTLNGKLFLVDLAGSERVKKSGVEGSAFDEAKAINQSLTILGRCIEILASNKKERPPFRESKLTRMLSNAIGGAAKTTLVVCVAPTMTDQFETVNSLEFGQQAMNVVVRARVNASTDFSSLCASLMAQRDTKQKPIHQLELKVLQALQPQLDEVTRLELECKEAELGLQLHAERCEATRLELEAVQELGRKEAEEDRQLLAEALNSRVRATEQLEQVLVEIGDNAEMRDVQGRHEAEKRDVLQTTVGLQEELQGDEMKERHERKLIESQTEGAIHTARNLGQLAAYFLQTGAVREAADFYLQAKAIFDAVLGPDHARTQKWQQELFFLINAPAIQGMLKDQTAGKAGGATAPAAGGGAPVPTPQEWWLTNMAAAGGGGGGGDDGLAFWMRNLYEMNWRDGDAPQGDGGGAGGQSGAPMFTPRGTLSLQPSASGTSSAAVAPPMAELQFATDWVEQVFVTPRAGASAEADVDARMVDAANWLQTTFATPREGAPLQKVHGSRSGAAPQTPRGGAPPGGSVGGVTQQSDDAVLAAAMQAVLATPRGSAAVDDALISGAASKIFKLPPKQQV